MIVAGEQFVNIHPESLTFAVSTTYYLERDGDPGQGRKVRDRTLYTTR